MEEAPGPLKAQNYKLTLFGSSTQMEYLFMQKEMAAYTPVWRKPDNKDCELNCMWMMVMVTKGCILAQTMIIL